MNRKTALVFIVVAFALVALAGCSYFQKPAALIADAIGGYCAQTTPAARAAVRQTLTPELVAEGHEICLGCAGEPTTICSGVHRPRVNHAERLTHQ